MTTYGFRFKFLLSSHSMIAHDSAEFEFQIPEERVSLKLKDAGRLNIGKSNKLLISGSGFESLDAAKEMGRKVRTTLMLCSVHLNMGIDDGDEEKFIAEGEDVFEIKEGLKIRGIDDVHGLCIFPEDLPIKVFSIGEPTVKMGPQGQMFADKFREIYINLPALTDKQKLTIELYSASHFELTLRARFITLVSAIECLAIRGDSSSEISSLVNGFNQMAKEKLNGDELNYFMSRLGELKKESISRACQSLVEKYLGPGAADELKKYYDIRSKMVHLGSTPPGVNLGAEVSNLDGFVSRLISANLK